MKTHGMIWLH